MKINCLKFFLRGPRRKINFSSEIIHRKQIKTFLQKIQKKVYQISCPNQGGCEFQALSEFSRTTASKTLG